MREVVLMGLKLAFRVGQELEAGHLLEAMPEIRPLSQTDPERVAALTEWLGRHTKPASGTRCAAAVPGANAKSRRRRMAV